MNQRELIWINLTAPAANICPNAPPSGETGYYSSPLQGFSFSFVLTKYKLFNKRHPKHNIKLKTIYDGATSITRSKQIARSMLNKVLFIYKNRYMNTADIACTQ